jgi:hypothetical protein
MDHWFFGGALSYTDIKARLQIPETFVVAPNLVYDSAGSHEDG